MVAFSGAAYGPRMLALSELGALYGALKDALSTALGLTHWHLHVVVGLSLFGLTALLARRWWPSWWLLAPVAALEAGNEVVDFLAFYSADAMRFYVPSYAFAEAVLTLGPPAAVLYVLKLRKSAALIRRSA